MIMLLEHYQPNKETIAYITAQHIDYNTIILEGERTYYCKKTPFELVKDNCIANWSSYEGRRKAVMKLTNYFRKVPIIISQLKEIVIFPTHSPENVDCNWIFVKHVLKISKCSKKKGTIITFNNGRQLHLNVSHHIIESQFHRTFHVLHQTSN